MLAAKAYIHDESLSHNDVKCNTALISNNGTAIIADFRFLTLAVNFIQRYAPPVIYRCTKDIITESGLTSANGKK